MGRFGSTFIPLHPVSVWCGLYHGRGQSQRTPVLYISCIAEFKSENLQIYL